VYVVVVGEVATARSISGFKVIRENRCFYVIWSNLAHSPSSPRYLQDEWDKVII
jgi:hypothetical protein